MARKTKMKQWLEDSDTTFRTLVTPISFVISITCAFGFFLAQIFVTLQPTAFTEEIISVFIKFIAFNLAVFLLSIFFWSWSIFLKRKGGIKKWGRFKFKVNAVEWSAFFKWVALAILWGSLLLVPFGMMSVALAYAYNVTFETASKIFGFFAILLAGITFLISVPPFKKKRKKKG